MSNGHKKLETNISLMAIFIVIAVSLGGLVEIVPLIFMDQVRQPAEGVVPYPALQLAGRDVYVREGCYNCHSQMIRPFLSETERYGPYSVAGESVYDRPFQWGSKRTGPDLARVGGRYSDEWHYIHLRNPRDVVPESNMPNYAWLEDRPVSGELIQKKMRKLRMLGDPYSDEDIAAAASAVEGKNDLDAVIAYLQGLGHARSGR
ncbi:MAG: cytochrome-c oxidase, cbb3-type subunit II [Gammaproteobacteria bacterium]|nr:cytochrome-c oxidase, cbb3-type subunit II [Gammaproteobacteria bacterium]